MLWIIYLIPAFLMGGLFCLVILILIRRKLRLDFVLIDAETKAPQSGVAIFGLSSSRSSELGQTSSGEFVHVPSGNTVDSLKKLGRTDQNGEFKAEYLMSNFGLIVFDILNEYSLPNQILTDELRITDKYSKKKVIERLPSGKLKVKNPTPREKLVIKTRLDDGSS